METLKNSVRHCDVASFLAMTGSQGVYFSDAPNFDFFRSNFQQHYFFP